MSYSWGSYPIHDVMNLPLSKKYASSSGPISNDQRPISKAPGRGGYLIGTVYREYKNYQHIAYIIWTNCTLLHVACHIHMTD